MHNLERRQPLLSEVGAPEVRSAIAPAPIAYPAMDCVATVLSSVALTPTIQAIRLQLDQPDFRFWPGQSVWPRFQRDGKQFSKIYSIASSPSRCPEVELCVSRVGWSSAYLQDLPIGGAIALRGPYGLMTLAHIPDRPRLYIAEGSGIAPLKSQIDWLREQGFDQPVWLVQANPETPDCLPYEADWRSLQQQWPLFHYLPTQPNQIGQTLAQASIDLTAVDVDICAVGDRSAQLQDVAGLLGAKLDQVRSESFYAF
ncbi:MAG: FAD-dependent oxidoreductase [Elainellaceae cyanobacterium]